MAESKTENNIGYAVFMLAIIAVGFAAVNSYFTFSKYSKISDLTGLAGSEGYVNVTVATSISVNFTKDAVLWGVGTIDNGQNNATLIAGDGTSTAVARGNWTTTGITALSLVNIGGINASLRIASDKNAASIFGGSAGHRDFKLNFSASDPGSCVNDSQINLDQWYDMNTTGIKVCSQLGFLDTQDQVNLSVWLTVPYDGNTGALTTVITATAATAG